VHTPARSCSAAGETFQVLVLLLFNIFNFQEYNLSSRRHAVRLKCLDTLHMLHTMQHLLPALLKGECICNFEILL
jgi:hypothetical protein